MRFVFKNSKRSVFSKNWLIHDTLDKYVENAINKYAVGLMLDIGCGDSGYRESAKPYIKKYIGIDLKDCLHKYAQIDIFGLAENIPVKTESCDTVLCAEVLEHVREPSKVISEINRVLKKGGYCIVLAPFIWPLHNDPGDFFRYSKFGLEHLLKKNNFKIISSDATGGFWLTFGQLLVYCLWRYRKGSLSRRVISIAGAGIQLLSCFLDRRDKVEDFTSNYICVAQK